MVRKKKGLGYLSSRLMLLILLVCTFFPFAMMINMALKKNVKIKLDFLAWPSLSEINWANFTTAWSFVKRPIGNSLLICFTSLVLILVMVSLSGYAFGRMKFHGKASTGASSTSR